MSTMPPARKLGGVSRITFSRVLNGRADISPQMALRLEKSGGSNADFWIRLLAIYDLAQAQAILG